jgi:membrane-bound serine protease (ClpP class)
MTMKQLIFTFLGMICIAMAADKNVLGKSEEESFEGKIVVIKVGEDDLMNGQSFRFWERTLERVTQEKAKAVIFDLDTPGGMAIPTKELMTSIANLEIPTRAFVNDSALSAGALISVATDRIYMTPGSVIGSAGVVLGTGQTMDETMRAKIESFFDAHVRWIADRKGHDQKVIRAMMIRQDEVQEFGNVRVEKGGLLALNSADAVQVMEDGPLLAEAEIASLEQLLARENWDQNDLIEATPSGFEKMAWWIASLSGLLIAVGLFGGYLEFKTPGFGLGGIISIIAFSLFFFGNYLAGKMAGYELAAVFALGILLIIVEIFVFPGFGLPGLTGLVLVMGSLGFAMVDQVEWQKYQVSQDGSFFDAVNQASLHLGLGIFGSILLLYLLMKYLPDLPFFNRHLLPGSLPLGSGGEVNLVKNSKIGLMGVTLTDLRPAGKAEFEQEVHDVMAEGEFLTKGQRIRVIREDGMGLVVERLQDEEGDLDS